MLKLPPKSKTILKQSNLKLRRTRISVRKKLKKRLKPVMSHLSGRHSPRSRLFQKTFKKVKKLVGKTSHPKKMKLLLRLIMN